MEKTKIKSIMLISIILVSTIVGLSVFVKLGTANLDESISEISEQENVTSEPQGTVTVTGTAQQTCEPDLLCIYLKIITLDPNSAIIARDEAAGIIDRVLKSLKDLGVPEDDIETASYDIEAKYEWENNIKVFKGFEVTVTMKVTLKDFNKAGQVIDTSVNAGALIDSISFELSKNKQNDLKTLLMADAARDAKAKAKAVVEALDEKLGNVKSINIDNYVYNPYYYYIRGSYNSINLDESVLPTSILPSDLIISASVNIVFEIL
ncbi:MAG: SIMPL domain-containing protein [Candidatus Thermoplasmatota archaeon]|nr:SIMPL domain-containing protein [Candidatus Thermoplasmatota archaeon]